MGKPRFNNAKPQTGGQAKQGNHGDWCNDDCVYNRLVVSDDQITITNADKWRIFARAVFLGCLLTLSMLLTFLAWAYDGEALFATKSLLQAKQSTSNKLTGSNTTTTTSTDSDSVEWIYPNDCPNLDSLTITSTLSSGSNWTVEYDTINIYDIGVPGLPVLKLNAKDQSSCSCRKDFALILTLGDKEEISGWWDWFKLCGTRILFMKWVGCISSEDIKKLKPYIPYAEYLPLKGILKVDEIGGSSLDGIIKTREMYINNVEVSGYATAQTMEDILEGVPDVMRLTIQGSSICSGFKRKPESECQKKLVWEKLKTLSIVEVADCSELFEFIYSCWEMPNIEIFKVKKSQLNDVVAYYIMKIIHNFQIKDVDMKDNVCFGNYEASLCDK